MAPNQPLRPTASKISTSPDVPVAKTARVINTEDLVFGKENFKWIFIGMGVMLLGFILMSGGSMPDANTWDPNIIYSFRKDHACSILNTGWDRNRDLCHFHKQEIVISTNHSPNE